MKTKLLLACAALALLFTACEEDEEPSTFSPRQVNIRAGLPSVCGYADIDYNKVAHPVSEANVVVYRTKEDYLLGKNKLIEGVTDTEGLFTFSYDSAGSLWFRAYKDTLSNLRGVNRYGGSPEHNEIVIAPQGVDQYENYSEVFATLTNTPTKLRLLIYHEGQPVEGAQVQLYFTEQAYQDSLAAQEDFKALKPTYGYPTDDPTTSDNISSFIRRVKDNFLQTTNETGEVYFDNLEPRNYWFRITKDTLSNEGVIVRTREALPRDAEIITQMEIGIE